MNEQPQIDYPELIAALDYERKQSAKFEGLLNSSRMTCNALRDKVRAEKSFREIAESKLKKLGAKPESAALEAEKNLIIDEILSATKNSDSAVIERAILRLRNENKFWRAVKSHTVNSIIELLKKIKTDDDVFCVLSKLTDR